MTDSNSQTPNVQKTPAPVAPQGYEPSPRYATADNSGTAPLAVKPRNPYILAVISLFFPGGTFAIPALFNAGMIDDYVADGKFTQAQKKSSSATRWLIVSWIFNVLFFIAVFVTLALEPVSMSIY